MTSVCVLDEGGRTVQEGKAASDPSAIAQFLRGERRRYGRVILEAGSLSTWLYEGLAKAGFPVIVAETRHASGILKGSRNKTDRNDARGLAEMARTGLFHTVSVKSERSQRLQALLTTRGLLVAKAVDLETAIRGLLRGFGLKLGVVSVGRFHSRVTAMIGEQAWLNRIVRPLLRARTMLREEAHYLRLELLDLASSDRVCKLLMTAPGVGPMVALSYAVAIDEPARFSRSRSVGAYLGLTQRVRQSGEFVRHGRISCWGDEGARRALFLAARALLNPRTASSWLKVWGEQIASRAGAMKALIAVARRLAVILHRMWVDGTEFRREHAVG